MNIDYKQGDVSAPAIDVVVIVIRMSRRGLLFKNLHVILER